MGGMQGQSGVEEVGQRSDGDLGSGEIGGGQEDEEICGGGDQGRIAGMFNKDEQDDVWKICGKHGGSVAIVAVHELAKGEQGRVHNGEVCSVGPNGLC